MVSCFYSLGNLISWTVCSSSFKANNHIRAKACSGRKWVSSSIGRKGTDEDRQDQHPLSRAHHYGRKGLLPQSMSYSFYHLTTALHLGLLNRYEISK